MKRERKEELRKKHDHGKNFAPLPVPVMFHECEACYTCGELLAALDEAEEELAGRLHAVCPPEEAAVLREHAQQLVAELDDIVGVVRKASALLKENEDTSERWEPVGGRAVESRKLLQKALSSYGTEGVE